MALITSNDPITQDTNVGETAQMRYDALAKLRQPFLDRARNAANVTIPALGPPAHISTGDDGALTDPFQSVGARGVNNLAAKLLLALLPPGAPFFKLTLDDFILEQLAAAAGAGNLDDIRGQFEEALSTVERSIMTRIEQLNVRAPLFETLKQLLVAGNAMPFFPPEKGGQPRLYRLHEYVIKRDSSGKVLEFITLQMLSPTAIPDKLKPLVDSTASTTDNATETEGDEGQIGLYTWVRRNGNHWKVRQEVNGQLVPKSEGTFPIDRLPWIPLRFTRIDNEDYGRGYVEEYMGDLRSLESLSQSLVEGAAAAARVNMMVDPSGVTDEDDVANAENLEVISGQARDITFLKVEKSADFSVAQQEKGEIKRDLQQAFLLFSSVQRDAERVTAEEIRLLASELEDALGGVYSILTQELQLPMVSVIMTQLQKEGRLPKLPKEAVSPQITTGLEALGRNMDLRRMEALIGSLAGQYPPEELALWLPLGPLLRRKGVALGLDISGLIRTQEQVDEIRQQQQQAALAASMAPEGLKQAGNMVQAQLENTPEGGS